MADQTNNTISLTDALAQAGYFPSNGETTGTVDSIARNAASDANQLAQEAKESADNSAKVQTLPATTRALPFNFLITNIAPFTTTGIVNFTLNAANAKDGSSCFLVITQNHDVNFPSGWIRLRDKLNYVPGKVNYYLITRLAGAYQWLRYQSADDSISENSDIIVGSTIVSASNITETSAQISWAAATNALLYDVYKYLQSDYSDTPVLIAEDQSDLIETVTGLTAGTDYYFKVVGKNGNILGQAGLLKITTTIAASSYTTFADFDFSTASLNNNEVGSQAINGDNISFYAGNHTGVSIINGKIIFDTPSSGNPSVYLAGAGWRSDKTYKFTLYNYTPEQNFSGLIKSTYAEGVQKSANYEIVINPSSGGDNNFVFVVGTLPFSASRLKIETLN